MTQEQGWGEHDEHADGLEEPPNWYSPGDVVRFKVRLLGEVSMRQGTVRSQALRGGVEGYDIVQSDGVAIWVVATDVIGLAQEPQEEVEDALAVMRQSGTPDTHARLLASQLLWLVAREVNPTATRATKGAARELRQQVYRLLEAQIAELNGHIGVTDGEQITPYEATIRFGETLGGVRLAMDTYASPQDMPQEVYDAIRERLRMLAALEALIYRAGATNPDFPHIIGTVILS